MMRNLLMWVGDAMLTRDEVIWGFRYCLGRDPESEKVVADHRNFKNWSELRSALLYCPEFVNTHGYPAWTDRWVIAPVLGGKCRMWVDLGDRYVSRGCILDNYEPCETRFVRDHLKPGDAFLDVGANIGWYTLLGSTIVGEEGAVYAIEPRAGTFDRLQDTIALNNLQNRVKLYRLAASDHGGAGFLSAGSRADNPGGSYISPESLGDRVELSSIDSLGIEKIDFIKIDVEGSEYKAIMGAIGLITTNRPVIMSEVLPSSLQHVSGKSPYEYLKVFLDIGYRIFLIDEVHGGKEIRDYPTWWERDLLNVGMIPNERL